MTVHSRRATQSPNIWPGFVDALSTLLLVLIFLLVVFVLAEFFLGRMLSGRDEALERLNQQVAELADLLSLEQSANNALRGEMTQISAQLQASIAERDDLSSEVTSLLSRQRDLLTQLETTDAAVNGQEASRDDLRLQLAAAVAMLEAARATEQDALESAADSRQELSDQRSLSTAAQRQVALLNQQIAQLRLQLATVEKALEASEAEVQDQKVQIADLGSRLNVALATKVEELSRYRSEFFGRLRDVLAGRSDVSIQGDRFVIQSGVLFASGSAAIGAEGQRQVEDLAELLLEITSEIPPDVNWILRIDGHTDKRPVRSTSQYQSNWELSSARAITVAQNLIENGVAPDRLVAAGFGEFHPIDSADNAQAYLRNRRIELKLTER